MPDFTTKQREKLAEEDEAMPDGSYPIRNRADLKRAIQAFGRSKNPDKTKAWIKKRARELDAEDLIPESWIQHMDDDSEYLIHYGVMGMKWGVRRANKERYIKDRAKAYQKRETEDRRLEKKYPTFKSKEHYQKYLKESHAADARYRSAVKKAKADYKSRNKNIKNSVMSRKEYSQTVKKNKQILRDNQQKFMLSYGNKKAMKAIQKENKTAVKAINDARVRRGKKKVNKILHNLPGTLV